MIEPVPIASGRPWSRSRSESRDRGENAYDESGHAADMKAEKPDEHLCQEGSLE